MSWAVLEQIPGQAAVAVSWRKWLGDQFQVFASSFLQRSRISAHHFPCPNECGCAHEIIVHGNGDFVGICRCEDSDCEDLLLTPGDILVWDLNWSKFGRALCHALELAPRPADLAINNTKQIGSWSADAIPVILTLQSQRSVFHGVVAELAASIHRPFILLAPTANHLDAKSLSLLHHAGAAFLDLQSILTHNADGTLRPIKPPRELFTLFRSADAPPAALAVPSMPLRAARYALRLGLGCWGLTYDGREAELKHERGILYVAYLLTHPPETPIHALDLLARIPELYSGQAGLDQLTDPASGRSMPLESHARLQERSLALDDAQSLRSLHRKQKELQAILDNDAESEPVKQEALRELAAISEFQVKPGCRAEDSAQRAAKAVRRAIGRFYEHLLEARDHHGKPHPVLHPFANHLLKQLLIPSARYSGRPKRHAREHLAGCFTYEPIAGITWVS